MPNTINIDIPGGSLEAWRAAQERAKQVYWEARSKDLSENWALKAVVDDMLKQQAPSEPEPK